MRVAQRIVYDHRVRSSGAGSATYVSLNVVPGKKGSDRRGADMRAAGLGAADLAVATAACQGAHTSQLPQNDCETSSQKKNIPAE